MQPGQKSYPLRPELAESTYWLYRATRDPLYLHVGRDIVASIQYGATCPCGYCHISDVQTHEKEDHMESFFLSETVSMREHVHVTGRRSSLKVGLLNAEAPICLDLEEIG
jgi:hypothetical protein